MKDYSATYKTLNKTLEDLKKEALANAALMEDLIARAAQDNTTEKIAVKRNDIMERDIKNAPWIYQGLIYIFKQTKRVIEKIIGFFGELFTKFFDAGAHYIVFFGVLFLLIFGTSVGLGAATSKNEQSEKIAGIEIKNMTVAERLMTTIKNFFKSIFMFDYRVKSYLRMFQKPNETQLTRPVEEEGRCDNVNHIETAGGGESTCSSNKQCVAATIPKDITWQVNTNTIADYDALPDTIKDSQKLTLYMPYKVTDSLYVPDCQGTYYIDASGNNQNVRLYDTDANSCRLHEESRTEYKDTKQRKDNTYDYER